MLRRLVHGLLVVAAVAAATLAASAGPAAAADPVAAAERKAMVRLLGDYRVSLGLPRLRVSARLSAEAQWYAADVALHDNFNMLHFDSLGRRPRQRFDAFGLAGADAAEIAAAGHPDAQATFDQWRTSRGHDVLVRRRSFRFVGVGIGVNPTSRSGVYWIASLADVDPRRSTRGRSSVTIQLRRSRATVRRRAPSFVEQLPLTG